MNKSERRKYIAELEGTVGRATMLHVRLARRIERLESELRAAAEQYNSTDYKMAKAVERAEHAERRLATVEGYAATFEKDHARILGERDARITELAQEVKEWSNRCDLRDVTIAQQAQEIERRRREAHVHSSD